MAAEAWLVHGAAALWARHGGPPPFPRSVEHLLPYGLQTRVVALPRLSLEAVSAHLRHLRLPELTAGPSRRLHGCLVVIETRRLVFVDSEDSAAEQRLTLAHETAHLWLEVLEPRDRVRELLGDSALEVLDGKRDPTHAERLHAALFRLPLRRPLHLLERDPEHGIRHNHIWTAEEQADRLALELLAPEAEARRYLPAAGAPFPEWLEQAGALLATQFGLPPAAAIQHARQLAPTVGAQPSFWERLAG